VQRHLEPAERGERAERIVRRLAGGDRVGGERALDGGVVVGAMASGAAPVSAAMTAPLATSLPGPIWPSATRSRLASASEMASAMPVDRPASATSRAIAGPSRIDAVPSASRKVRIPRPRSRPSPPRTPASTSTCAAPAVRAAADTADSRRR
jgi:hypothetical protein